MKPEGVAAGSQEQIIYALRDAQHDIAALAERVAELERCAGTSNDGVSDPDPICAQCEGGGWEWYGDARGGDPHFEVCRACKNPNGFVPP